MSLMITINWNHQTGGPTLPPMATSISISTSTEAAAGIPPLEQARRRRVLLRFAEFELEAARFELPRHGAAVALAPQPYDLLWLLASRPGALIGRDEIRRQLWGGGTF